MTRMLGSSMPSRIQPFATGWQPWTLSGGASATAVPSNDCVLAGFFDKRLKLERGWFVYAAVRPPLRKLSPVAEVGPPRLPTPLPRPAVCTRQRLEFDHSRVAFAAVLRAGHRREREVPVRPLDHWWSWRCRPIAKTIGERVLDNSGWDDRDSSALRQWDE